MNLSGLITVEPTDRERIEHAIALLGDSFLEEMWFATWLEAIDETGADDERKKTLLRAVFADDVEAFSPYGSIYLLEDMTAAVGGYRFSELQGETLSSIESRQAGRHFLAEASAQEAALLERRERDMEPISSFDWAREHAGGDHINFFAWAVDEKARGKGSLRRALDPFFAYADEHELNCYLECYADRLQSMYEHLGFELIDELHADGFDVYERRMVRYPKQTARAAHTA
ncbi:MAG: GNAT family N-acetyltransferase [Slackia sp.]|nr:GNAT family N-acetyltransferase [Slackia sp.]